MQYITPFDVNSTDADVAAFCTPHTQKKYGDTPDQFAADGYDAVKILYSAMTAAGVDNVTIDPASLADLVKPVLTGGTFSYLRRNRQKHDVDN